MFEYIPIQKLSARELSNVIIWIPIRVLEICDINPNGKTEIFNLHLLKMKSTGCK